MALFPFIPPISNPFLKSFLKTQNFLTFDFGCLFRIVLYYNLLTVFICFPRFYFVLLYCNYLVVLLSYYFYRPN